MKLRFKWHWGWQNRPTQYNEVETFYGLQIDTPTSVGGLSIGFSFGNLALFRA